MSDHIKHWIDAFSLAAVIGSLAAWLPPVAALLSILWTLIRIFETETVQAWVKSRRSNEMDS